MRRDRHARTGLGLTAVSAVDNALWDVRGRHVGVPVHRLLGGPTRTAVPAYASTLGASHNPDEFAGTARRLVEEGWAGQKWFFAYGPGDGPAGRRENVALARRLREAAGDDADLMFDAFTAFEYADALDWTRRVEHLRPRWLEEPFPPDRLDAFARLRAATRVPLAAGEHLYGRSEVVAYLRAGVLDVVQTDPEWCGGITELTRVCALTEPHEVPMIPHGHGLHAALHVAASQPPALVPMIEYLVNLMPDRHHFEVDPPTPFGGVVPIAERPGFGIELAADRIVERRVLRAL